MNGQCEHPPYLLHLRRLTLELSFLGSYLAQTALSGDLGEQYEEANF